MALSDLALFNEQSYSAYAEVLQDSARKFNEASNGGLILRSGSMAGDYEEEAFYARVAGLMRRRNPASTAAIPQVSMKHALENKIRIAHGTPEVDLTQGWHAWIGRDVGEAAAAFGLMLAEERLLDYLGRSVRVLNACLRPHNDVVTDVTGAGVADKKTSYGNLVRGASKFGDKSNRINCWFMHTSARTGLLLQNLQNANSLFSFGGVNVMPDAEGRPIITADLSELIEGGTKFLNFGLVGGAVVVEENDDYQSNTQTKNGSENILTTYQAQWSSSIAVRGHSYDTTTIVRNTPPSEAALAASANWERHVTSHKDGAGVVLITEI